MVIILLFELQRSLCCSIIPSSLAYVISKYDFGEKGGKSDNQSFYKKEDIALDPFFLHILSISSTSVHFSAKKEVSTKKGDLCTWLYLCMRFSYAQYVAVPCNTNFKLSFCWLLSQLGVIMIIWFNDMIQIHPNKITYYGYFWISATISPQISFLSLLKKRAMVIDFFLG